jgi:hypothetical protein
MTVDASRALLGRYARMVALVVGLALVATGAGTYARADDDTGAGGRAGCDPFIRTELFFGTEKPDGSEVSEEDFRKFLDVEITPRFPDGLTVLTGFGQFRGASGQITQERSELVILLYPRQAAQRDSKNIDQIRNAYTDQFDQESVLRADDPRPVCVSF